MRLLGVDVVTPAVGEVVTVQEFVDHARLNGLTVDNQPDLIARELAAATLRAEKYLRRSLLTQTLGAYYALDGRNCACALDMILPRGKVQSVLSVLGADDTAVTGYTLQWNTIILAAPATQPMHVLYLSGYGDTGADVPDAIREAILEYATTLYEDRRGAREAKYQALAGRTLPAGVIDLLRPYQIEVSG